MGGGEYIFILSLLPYFVHRVEIEQALWDFTSYFEILLPHSSSNEEKLAKLYMLAGKEEKL